MNNSSDNTQVNKNDIDYKEGLVHNIIFNNKENGYIVFTIEDEELEELLTCVGYTPSLIDGEFVKLYGSYVNHPSFGNQFTFTLLEKAKPKTVIGMEKYLASGIVKGIGKNLAKKIVQKFGIDTFKVIEQSPEYLADINGITIKKAKEIHQVFMEEIATREVMIFLQSYGISPIYSMKIYKKYRGNTIETMKTNPYKIADEINGIGFKLADSIAMKVGVPKNSPFRVKSAIKHVLNLASYNGHTYLPKDELVNETLSLLNEPVSTIENALQELQIDRVITQKNLDDTLVIYTNIFFYAENYIAKKLIELSNEVIDKTENLDVDIKKTEEKLNISLAPFQIDAVKEAMSQGVLVITGGPGTGKTTTINTIITMLELESYEVLLAAPTGRATKRMSETTKRSAKTIHRLLEINFANNGTGTSDIDNDISKMSFNKNEENPLEADVIILDETSMIDTMLMYHFLKAVEIGTRIIFVGDVDQLPSVGAGSVLKDIINSQCIHTVKLTEIFRQSDESHIVLNAHKVNNGQYPNVNSKDSDFYYVEVLEQSNMPSVIVNLVANRLPKFKNCSNASDIQVLSPIRKSNFGVNNLNVELQKVLNPPTNKKAEKEYRNFIFREGDKVMQVKNNYNITWSVKDLNNKTEFGTGVYNGDEGIIKYIDNENEFLTVIYDDNKLVEYDFTLLDELELSYAVTIHKSQGSEYQVVVIPIHNMPPLLATRNLLYTAITRGKELVVLVGNKNVINKMVDNNKEFNRYSSLSYYLKSIDEFLKGDNFDED